MQEDLKIKEGIIIPAHELEITSSRSGGAGGQHVNKTNSRVTLRWNVQKTSALTEQQKAQVLEKLHTTAEGDLIIHNSESRSQHQNKELALKRLANEIRRALYVPKKRMATRPTKSAVEKRLHSKSVRSAIKKIRNKKVFED